MPADRWARHDMSRFQNYRHLLYRLENDTGRPK